MEMGKQQQRFVFVPLLLLFSGLTILIYLQYQHQYKSTENIFADMELEKRNL